MISLENDFENNVFVENSPIHGYGIFAEIAIPENSKIMVIKGEAIDANECERREDEENNVYIFWNGDDCYIDTAKTEKIKYINHDCDCNCEVLDGDSECLILAAYRDIRPGEELTIDYGYEEIYETCTCKACV